MVRKITLGLVWALAVVFVGVASAGLETGTYINSLVATNPVGATDPKSQGDDHLRLIKSTILNTFPNITGAVTSTHTQLNYLNGATGTTGTGAIVFAASQNLSGTMTHSGTINAASLGTSPLNASNLSSGTIPDARFPATLPALNGSGLTSLTAANITAAGTLPALNGAALTALNGTNVASGTVADARLSSNIPLKNAANTFTANQTISNTSPSLTLNETDGNNTAPIAFQNNGASRALVGSAHAASALVAGTADGDFAIRLDSGGFFFSGDAGTTAHLKLSSAGVVTTPNASASEVGLKGVPVNTQNGDYSLVLADSGFGIFKASGGAGETITIPANASVAFPVGTRIRVYNDGGGSLTLAITSDTLEDSTGTTGNRSIADNGAVEIWKVSSTKWRLTVLA